MRLAKQHIVYRKGVDDGAILFAPVTGKVFALNATSAFIGEKLQKEISAEELLEQLRVRYPDGNPEDVKRDLWLFLGQLNALGYLEGFDCEGGVETLAATAANVEFVKSDALPENHLLYKGNSMARVFVPGDILVVRNIPMEEFSCGDIASFKKDGATEGIVHRIVRVMPGGFATMGDNNPVPDSWIVTAVEQPRLVVERIDASGRHHRIFRKRLGMMAFRWHRARYWTRRVLGKIYRYFFRR